MSYRWSIADPAVATIQSQLEWYLADERNGGTDLAERWMSRLQTALEKLALRPYSHGMAPENGRWLETVELRQMQFRPWRTGVGWRVIYTIDEGDKLVTILQIRHEHRRYLHEVDGSDE
jgi:mRNA-degrading endonuclease RelE of RelBE toxin-antitoxin system